MNDKLKPTISRTIPNYLLLAMLEAGAPLTYDERQQLERDAKAYKRFDQMSLAELEALVERLNKIIAGIKRQEPAQG